MKKIPTFATPVEAKASMCIDLSAAGIWPDGSGGPADKYDDTKITAISGGAGDEVGF
jgi:hypothetical protein